MKFHAWVDQVREEFVVASGIYKKVIPYAEGREATLLKFIEEEIIDYDGRKWGSLFGDSLEEEKAYASGTYSIFSGFPSPLKTFFAIAFQVLASPLPTLKIPQISLSRKKVVILTASFT